MYNSSEKGFIVLIKKRMCTCQGKCTYILQEKGHLVNEKCTCCISYKTDYLVYLIKGKLTCYILHKKDYLIKGKLTSFISQKKGFTSCHGWMVLFHIKRDYILENDHFL